MHDIGYYNGQRGPIAELTIPMTDRVTCFGDAVYDATCGKAGKVYQVEDHLDRFFNSCALVGIEPDFTKDWLNDLLHALLAEVDADECFVYWQLSRGTALRKHAYGEGMKPNLTITINPAPIARPEEHWDLISAEDTRFYHCNVKTVNLLPNVLVSQQAEQARCQECVFHRGERVTECAHSNISMLKDGAFWTAPTDNLILPGIARKHLIMACHKLGIPVHEEPFTMAQLMDADEVIVSSSSKFCVPADHIDGIAVGGRDAETLGRLQAEVYREFEAYIFG